jgi:hypothetical protein
MEVPLFYIMDMKAKKKVGIRYCGGCNPSYERVEMIQRLQSLLRDRFIFTVEDLQDSDIMVLVSGCPRACADKSPVDLEVSSRSIVGENDFESLIKWLTAFDEKGD